MSGSFDSVTESHSESDASHTIAFNTLRGASDQRSPHKFPMGTMPTFAAFDVRWMVLISTPVNPGDILKARLG